MKLPILLKTTLLLGLLLGLWFAGTSASAQSPQGQPAAGAGQPAGPDQPVVPQRPTLQQRPDPNQPLFEPFRLSPQEEAYLDQVLQAWERRSQGTKTFECNFARWEYDPVFGPADKPRYIDYGRIKFAAPDRGMLEISHTDKNGKMVGIEPERAEHWICDGKAILQYKHAEKQLIEYPLPEETQGKAIQDGPLPFLFGAEAAKLKQRYFLRVIATPEGRTGETWLEAFPRFQKDAADFRRAELILTNKDVLPLGLHTYLPNGKSHTAYQFYDIVMNDPLRFFKGDPFRASTPLGWQKIVEKPAAQQVSQPSAALPRR